MHLEKTNYKNRIFPPKSHLIAQRCLSRQFHVQMNALDDLISSPVENY